MLARLPLTGMSQQRNLHNRVVAVAEKVLAAQKYVTPLDVTLGIGWLRQPNIDAWRQGRVDSLDEILPITPDREAAFLEHLADWATDKRLRPQQADYVAATRDRRPLRCMPVLGGRSFRVPPPSSANPRRHRSTRRPGGSMADDRHQIAMAACLDPQNAEATVGIVEGDTFDKAGEHFLSCGFLHELLLPLQGDWSSGRE